ncbi:MAG: ribosome-associated translation inhibitor RaiA [Candidatus Magasanikbacteria bacterium]|nr:ribosome-associated translation inhibitor RaiA [Candidatus Magasanikbacteria bacterium]
MQVVIFGKGMELTQAIKDYTEKKFSTLEKYYNNILRAEVTVGLESRHHLKGKNFICECKLVVPGNDLFVAKEEADLYKAIDKVKDHLENELKKHKIKEREKDKKAKREIRDTKEYKVEE